MAPRARKVNATNGFIKFSKGITESQLKELYKANQIDLKDFKYETVLNETILSVPSKDEYTIPDEIYVWLA